MYVETASYEEEVYLEIIDDVDFNSVPIQTSGDCVTEKASTSSISPAHLQHHQHVPLKTPEATAMHEDCVIEKASTSSISPAHLQHHQHIPLKTHEATALHEDCVKEKASTSSISPAHLQHHQHVPLKTHEATAIYKVLKGMSDSIQKYDRKKDAFKQNPGKYVSLDDVLDMRAPLQTQTLKTISNLKQQLKEWEKSFMLQNNFRFPCQEDIESDPAIYDIQSRIATGEQLLQAWGIHM